MSLKMFALSLFTFIGLAGGTAMAARPAAYKMTCDQARQTVVRHGAVVMSTGIFTYDRFVSSQRYCSTGQVTQPAWIKTLDNKKCYVGFTCEQRSSSGGDRDGRGNGNGGGHNGGGHNGGGHNGGGHNGGGHNGGGNGSSGAGNGSGNGSSGAGNGSGNGSSGAGNGGGNGSSGAGNGGGNGSSGAGNG